MEERKIKEIPLADLVNMAEFVVKSNYFKFDSKFKKQIFGTAIRTKFSPSFASIFMD